MALCSFSTTATPSYLSSIHNLFKPRPSPLLSLSNPAFISTQNPRISSLQELRLARCSAAKQPSEAPSKKKRKTKRGGGGGGVGSSRGLAVKDVEIEDGFSGSESNSVPYQPLRLPKPPAGFILDDHGRVVMVSPKRIATIV
ncbi:hypothetical protein CK203_067117 [Vitis vinifera]|nr:hypothetical protein CK203_067117 [Vitis vinifera]